MPVEACVAKANKTPVELFDELVTAARHSAATNGSGSAWLSILMTLEHPVRMEAMAVVLDEDTSAIRSFCRALAPGVIIAGQQARFRDEDFEAYVYDSISVVERSKARQRIAQTYFMARNVYGWAAEAVAGHLSIRVDSAT